MTTAVNASFAVRGDAWPVTLLLLLECAEEQAENPPPHAGTDLPTLGEGLLYTGRAGRPADDLDLSAECLCLSCMTCMRPHMG